MGHLLDDRSQYLEGRSLQAIILEHAPLGADLLVSVSLQLLETLRFAHRRKIVRGDIQPPNIIIGRDGAVRLVGDGRVKPPGDDSVRTTEGRPADPASELYSLGMVMYEMATGFHPFPKDEAGNTAERPVLPRPPTPRTVNPLLSERLEAIIMRSLGLGPLGRYPSAQVMLDDLRGMEEDGAGGAPNGFAQEAARVMAAAVPASTASAGPERTLPEQGGPPPRERGLGSEPEEQPGRPRRAWPWALVTVLILALAAAAYVVISNREATAKPQFASVPLVVGLLEATAITKIQAAGFDWRIGGRQGSADLKEGYVLSQDTVGGTRFEKGRVIGIWVSSGTGQVPVPNVVGLPQAEAAEKLDKAGLHAVAKPEVDSEAPIGRVLRQNPEADKKVDPGTTVTITVVAATNTVKVPPLAGTTQENAVALLKSMNLVAEVRDTDSALPGGIVDRQDPTGGSEVQPGTTVRIFVSNAPPAKTVLVPAVGALGLTEAEAKIILAKYRLKAYVVDLETPKSKPGLCVYQDPAAGAEVKIGRVVNITIARKPMTTTLPPALPGAVRYDQTDTHIVKIGIWADYQASPAYLGSYGRSNTGKASATIYFAGTRLDWIAMTGTTTGMADVYLDGIKKATVNLTAGKAVYAVDVWSTGTLPRGSHRVTIVLSSGSPVGKYLTLDAVDIWGIIRSPDR